MPTAVDIRLAPLLHAQHHVLSRRQAIEAGCTARMIDRRLATGAWRAVAPGVYRVAGAPASVRSDLVAACLHLGAVASHEAAAALHGLHAAPRAGAVVTVPTAGGHRSPVAQVHESGVVPADHVTVVDGIPCTTVARTLVDLAGVVRRSRLERVVDDALVARRCTFDDLDNAFGALARRGRPGIAAMRQVLAARGRGVAVPESELEARLLGLLAVHGVPRPRPQAPRPWDPAPGRVDAAWPEERLVVEADGRRWHARYDRFAADRARDRDAVLAGWRVLRFSWEDVVGAPAALVAQVRSALRPAA